MEGGTFLSRSPRYRTEGQDCHWWVALTTHMTQAQPPHRRHPPATVQNSWRETQQCPPTKGKALRIAMWRDGSKEKGPWPITKKNPNGSSGNIVISWSHGEPPFPLGKLALCPYFIVFFFFFFSYFIVFMGTIWNFWPSLFLTSFLSRMNDDICIQLSKKYL